jgi:hypothetical protein
MTAGDWLVGAGTPAICAAQIETGGPATPKSSVKANLQYRNRVPQTSRVIF